MFIGFLIPLFANSIFAFLTASTEKLPLDLSGEVADTFSEAITAPT
jgi:hypothetical protein